MTRAVAALAVILSAMLLAWSPVMAHGENTHGKEKAATAPATTQVMPDGAAGPVAEPAPAADFAMAPARDVMTLLRNLHPATVHFAIALFVVAGLTEAVAVFRPSKELEGAVQVMVVAGAFGAVVAALFGWIHTGIWFGGGGTMQWHRWMGTGLAIAGVIAALPALHRPQRRNMLRAMLIILTIAILAQAYLGGELAHGIGHLWEH